MAVAVEIIILLLLYKQVSIKDILLFSFAQGTVFQFWTPDSLRGYGVGTPNGALWTICVLMQFYLIAWFVYKFLKKKKYDFWILILCTSIGLSILLDYGLKRLSIEIFIKLYEQTVIRYFWMFFMGMIVSNFFEKIIGYIVKFCWIALSFSIIIRYIIGNDIDAGYGVFATLFLLIGLIGFSYKFSNIKIKKDISYGIYLYHMTVINIFVTCGYTGKLKFLIAAIIFSILLAYLSSVTIGKLSQNNKQFILK